MRDGGNVNSMKTASSCGMCPQRDLGFCGALLQRRFEESSSLEDANWRRFRMVAAGTLIATQNQLSEDIFLLCSGWGIRFLQLAGGRRQILNFLLPGDLFSTTSVFEKRFRFSVRALTDVQIGEMRRAEVQKRLTINPGILIALGTSCVKASRAADEMRTALGQCSAEERVAYLFVHLIQRISERSVIREQRYPFPLRQQVIADAVGLTAVHVNRVLGLFRRSGLAELSNGVLQVLNLPELERIGSLN